MLVTATADKDPQGMEGRAIGQISLQTPVLGLPDATEEAKIVTDLGVLQTVINGNLETSNFATGAVEPAFSTFKNIVERRSDDGPLSSATTYFMGPSGGSGGTVGSGSANRTFYLDPADFAAGSRQTRLRLEAVCVVNAVAPAATLTVGLYPIATWSGASGFSPTINTLGAGVATVAFATPGAGSATRNNSSEVQFPAAGFYALVVTTSANTAAGAAMYFGARVQMRQV